METHEQLEEELREWGILLLDQVDRIGFIGTALSMNGENIFDYQMDDGELMAAGQMLLDIKDKISDIQALLSDQVLRKQRRQAKAEKAKAPDLGAMEGKVMQ